MQDLCKRLKPSNFEDIIAVLALYRPGPMESGMLDDFIERKHGRAKIDYFYDELEAPLKPILENTYGVIVYQEQVMQIVQSIGGFSLGGADLVRRAMGKKIKEEMDRLKGEFADGAQNKGYTRAYVEELFDLIVKFAGYGFNKSHSAAYALVTFYTSYLKCYYPAEFMAALLTLEKDNTDKVVKYVDEVKRLGLDLFPPDINKSDLVFSAKKIDGEEVVMFGMGAIKGAGDVAINSILKARQDGLFKDLSDFISRIDGSKVNKRVLESLTKAGAFDSFGYSRRALLEQIEKIVETVGKVATAKKMMTGSLFGDNEEMIKMDIELEHLPEFDSKDILELEKASLGFYVSGHPLDEYREQIEKINYTLSSQIEDLDDGSQAIFVGKIENIVEKISKKGNKFGIATIMDFHGNIELMLFEDRLKELKEEYNLDEPIAFKVRISKDENFTRMSILKIETILDAQKERVKTKQKEIQEPPMTIAIPFSDNENLMYKLYELVVNNQGKRELKLLIKSKLADLELETGIKVSTNLEALLHQIEGAYIVDETHTTDK
jgi:DNA polymerase-3 subunit alpha